MGSAPIVAQGVLPAGTWDGRREKGRLVLRADERLRRRARFSPDGFGGDVLLDLPRAVRLHEGDGLDLGAAGVIRIAAAKETVLEIKPGVTRLARIAYHFGNRHLAVQIEEDRLVVLAARVSADLARALGAEVCEVERPFEPEAGAHAEHAHDDIP